MKILIALLLSSNLSIAAEKEYHYIDRSNAGYNVGDFSKNTTLWTPKNEQKKYWNLDGDTVQFIDCIGGQMGYIASYSIYNCYLPTTYFPIAGERPSIGSFRRFYVHIASGGAVAAWERQSVRFHCRIPGVEKLINENKLWSFMPGAKVGATPLVGGRFGAFKGISGACVMYGLSGGYAVDASIGAMLIWQTGEDYM